jgi:hypothetical protein
LETVIFSFLKLSRKLNLFQKMEQKFSRASGVAQAGREPA